MYKNVHTLALNVSTMEAAVWSINFWARPNLQHNTGTQRSLSRPKTETVYYTINIFTARVISVSQCIVPFPDMKYVSRTKISTKRNCVNCTTINFKVKFTKRSCSFLHQKVGSSESSIGSRSGSGVTYLTGQKRFRIRPNLNSKHCYEDGFLFTERSCGSLINLPPGFGSLIFTKYF
jgi:hypothetical protein